MRIRKLPLYPQRCPFSKSSSAVEDGPDLTHFIGEVQSDGNGCGKSVQSRQDYARLPEWLKVPIPAGSRLAQMRSDLRRLNLSTVCEEAKCPNIGDCWNGRASDANDNKQGEGDSTGVNYPPTATIMLMGSECTRACRFCSVRTSRRPAPLDPEEPARTAEAIVKWGLEYVVLTTVDRDGTITRTPKTPPFHPKMSALFRLGGRRGGALCQDGPRIEGPQACHAGRVPDGGLWGERGSPEDLSGLPPRCLCAQRRDGAGVDGECAGSASLLRTIPARSEARQGAAGRVFPEALLHKELPDAWPG